LEQATTVEDVGQYPMTITLMDETEAAYQQQLGNAGSKVDNKWIIYSFTMTIYERKFYNNVAFEKPPDVRLESVFLKYKSNVIDVRKFDLDEILDAEDTTIVKNLKPKLADPNTPITIITLDHNKTGVTNSTVPLLPRVIMTEKGTKTNVQKAEDD
jgi:hypothetical protein